MCVNVLFLIKQYTFILDHKLSNYQRKMPKYKTFIVSFNIKFCSKRTIYFSKFYQDKITVPLAGFFLYNKRKTCLF